MKIIVDELPKEPNDCPYSKIVTEAYCSRSGYVCKDTKQCKFLKPISDYKVDVYNSPVYGVLKDY